MKDGLYPFQTINLDKRLLIYFSLARSSQIQECNGLYKKDLIKVTKNSELDKTRREKAETILNNWENWTSLRENSKITMVEQFATGNPQVINNHIKHCRDVSNGREVTTPSKKNQNYCRKMNSRMTNTERNVDEPSDSVEGVSLYSSRDNSFGNHNEEPTDDQLKHRQ
ncbi:4570_t:CDS:2 [Diversispora eburnea]|uniref:4570_t:CDS:1 n=1 Tax=Diversispora eburnea TaxID=1213867 RepID=A0A9N9FH13_9GLOM|nr:4570_t:CDS:2 [Diversispora eburnea]